jgi:hypothetical protein
MRIIKGFILAVLALSLILLTACAGDDQNQSTTVSLATETAETEQTPRSTPVLPSSGSPLQTSDN